MTRILLADAWSVFNPNNISTTPRHAKVASGRSAIHRCQNQPSGNHEISCGIAVDPRAAITRAGLRRARHEAGSHRTSESSINSRVTSIEDMSLREEIWRTPGQVSRFYTVGDESSDNSVQYVGAMSLLLDCYVVISTPHRIKTEGWWNGMVR